MSNASYTNWFGGLVATLFACNPSNSQEVVVDHSRWVLVEDSEQDPLYDIDDDEASCPISSFGAEGTIFEIETGTCNYATFTQSTTAVIRAGDRLEFLLWHLNLWDELPGEAHVAIQIGDWLMWENYIDIPADAEVYDGTIEVPSDIPTTSAYLHLHNHGVNSWRFADITLAAP